jgi:hypothetical protein
MTFEDFLKAIERGDPRRHVSDFLLFQSPFIFEGAPALYNEFRAELTSALRVPGRSIAIVGSSQLGFSLSPQTMGAVIRADSDIDVVVVSEPHFDQAWLELNELDRDRWRLEGVTAARMERCRVDLFWGFIRLWQLPRSLRVARSWLPVFDRLSTDVRFGRRRVGGRLYRTWAQVEIDYSRSIRNARVPKG